jgi:hypothetical protein
MRRVLVVAAAALLTATLAVGTVAGAGNLWKAPPFSAIGINTVWLDPNVDYREVGPDQIITPNVLMIFVETGSSSNKCLATLNEMWWNGDPQGHVTGLFCAVRHPTIDGVVRNGVGLHVFFSDPVGDNLNLLINAYQEGAKYYREPVPCLQNNCGG